MNMNNTQPKRKRLVIDEKAIGHYGALRLRYIREYKPKLYRELRRDGTIEEYLIRINKSACEAFDTMVKQYAESEGTNEQLRINDPDDYRVRMNTIKATVSEIILHDYVYY